MIRRILAGVFVIWVFGFVYFTLTLPEGVDDVKTQAVVVPTGGEGRIARGIQVLSDGGAKTLFVSGVNREVRPQEFAAQFDVPDPLMQCCVQLGFDAVDTRGNGEEIADWVLANKVRSVRLVTTDWHMRRAAAELDQRLPPNIRIVRDAVPSSSSLSALMLEYTKYLASRIGHVVAV